MLPEASSVVVSTKDDEQEEASFGLTMHDWRGWSRRRWGICWDFYWERRW